MHVLVFVCQTPSICGKILAFVYKYIPACVYLFIRATVCAKHSVYESIVDSAVISNTTSNNI